MLGWIFSSLSILFIVFRERKQAALEAIQLNLMAIQSATQHAVDIVTAGTGTTLQTNVGTLNADATVDQAVQTFITTTLNTPNLAGNAWLQVAAFAQGAGCPILANSIATLGVVGIHNGTITTP
jgi:hypothetical protein